MTVFDKEIVFTDLKIKDHALKKEVYVYSFVGDIPRNYRSSFENLKFKQGVRVLQPNLFLIRQILNKHGEYFYFKNDTIRPQLWYKNDKEHHNVGNSTTTWFVPIEDDADFSFFFLTDNVVKKYFDIPEKPRKTPLKSK